jgi:hypothetical protein
MSPPIIDDAANVLADPQASTSASAPPWPAWR